MQIERNPEILRELRYEELEEVGSYFFKKANAYKMMSDYNRDIEYNSESFAPGSKISQEYKNQLKDYPIINGKFSINIFGIEIKGVGRTLSYVHAGIDRTKGSAKNIISPLYYKIVKIEVIR